MRKILLTLVAWAFILTSCERKAYFAFDDVIYVHDFPNEYELGDADTLDVDLIGIRGVKSFGDYLLVSCSEPKGCLSTVSLEDKPKVTNSFLMIGSGPGEVLYRPYISWMSFYEKDGRREGGVYDYTGSFLELDISQDSLSNAYRYLSRSLPTVSGSRYFYVSPNRFLCRRSKGDGSGFERFLVDSLGRECHIASMDYLNEISSSEQNLLSSSIVIDDKSGTVAEASSYLNVIHLYSLDASRKGFAKTVALGNRLVDIRDVERQGLDLIPRTYYDVHPYKGFFAALYVGAKMEDFEQGICPHPAIHLFSWTGEPLAKIHLPVNALLFDIDAENSTIYVVEMVSEKILRYAMKRQPISSGWRK